VTPRNLRLSTFNLQPVSLALLLATIATLHSAPTPTYTFDDGLLPAGTTLWATTDSSGNPVNPGAGVTNADGLNNSGMLILTVPASGQTFEQWLLPDFANGNPITNLATSFYMFVGGPTNGGNGLVFHWGPGLKNQYSGSASSFGLGLDVTFRTYGSGLNPAGINIYYGGTNTPGNNSPVASSSFLDYYRGGVTNFASNTWVSFSVNVGVTNSQTNATLSLVCSNAWDGLTNIYLNLIISNFTMPLASQPLAFTATDGSGAHEFCFLDSVDFTVNGSHVAGSNAAGPVVFTLQPASQTVPQNTFATFTTAVTGTTPFTYQWFSNSVAIPGASATSYTTPLTTLAMSGTVYTVSVSNSFGALLSSNALLSVVQATTPADLSIYTDHLVNGFQDWSYGTRNLANSSPVHSGTASISLSSVTSGHNISFWHPMDTSPYASLIFWANGGSGGGQVLQVQAMLNEVGQATYPLPTLTANAWQQFVIPLSALGADHKTNFDRILFKVGSGGTTNTFYLDDIEITAATAPATVHLTVSAAQALRTADARWFGINTATWDGNLDTAQTVSLLKEMGTMAMRFPGGSTADTYHWSSSSVNHFAHVATNIGAQAINTVNYGSGTSAEAAGWVGFCNVTNRYGFRYWEIGNECYGSWETDYNTNSPYYAHDAWSYATRAADYLQQMKGADPTIKIGVVVTPGETAYSNAFAYLHPAYNPRTGKTVYGWTPILLTTLKSLGVTPDFAVHHRYPEYTTLGSTACADSDPLVLQSTGAWAGDAADLRQQISDYFGAGGTNIELLVTENNSDAGRQGKQSVSLVNALYYAGSLAELMLTEFNGFVWWDLRNSTDTQGSLDPTLYGWRLYGDLGMINGLTNRYPQFYAAKLMQYFARPGDSILNASSDYVLVSAYAARRVNGAVTLLVLNGDTAVTFNAQIGLKGFAPSPKATLRSYGIPQDTAAQTGTGSPDIALGSFATAGTNFSYNFPPLSLTLFTFAPAAPSLTVLPPPPQPGGQVVLQIQGQPGVYVIQTSTNLSTWTAACTNTLSGNTANVTNSVPPGSTTRFWRAMWQP
jgi:hypothetical protein